MTDQANQRLKRINDKGLAIATRLAQLMAGKDVDLSELGDLRGLDLIDMKEVRLRSFLDQINAARTRLGTTEYGQCTVCDRPYDDATLDETPWISQCASCQAATPIGGA